MPQHELSWQATIVVTFVGTLVAVPPPNVDNIDCQHQDRFDSTLRGINWDLEPSVPTKCDDDSSSSSIWGI